MGRQTENYGLIKPAENEYYDINIPNNNMDIIDEELKNHEIDLEEIRENTETVLTSTLSQHKSIFSAGTGFDAEGVEQDIRDIIKGGQSKIRIEGFTARNSINNGNFENSTAGWTHQLTFTPTVTNNELTFTATALNEGIHQNFRAFPNHKYYACATILGSAEMVLTDNVTMSYVIAHSDNIAKYEKLVLYQQLASNNLHGEQLLIRNNQSSGFTPIKVRDVMCINLTALFGAGNEPTKEQCDLMFDHYIQGLQGVGNHKIVSTGKNLFNVNARNSSWLISSYGIAPDRVELMASTADGYVSYLVRVKPNTTYTFSFISESEAGPSKVWIFQTDLTTTLSSEGSKYTGGQFNSKHNTEVLIVIYANANVRTIFKNIQIEEGSTATEYEPYQYSECSITMPSYAKQMHRLPNGVCDSIEEINGVDTFVCRTLSYALRASDITTLNTSFANIDGVCIARENLSGIYPLQAGVTPDKMIVQGFTKCSVYSGYDNAQYAWTFMDSSSFSADLYLFVPKGTYASLAAVQAALAGTNIIYERMTVTFSVSRGGGAGFKTEGNLEIFEGGTIYQKSLVDPKYHNNARISTIYNLSDKAIEMANSNEFTALYKMINGKLKNNAECVESGSNSNAFGYGNTTRGERSSAFGYLSEVNGVESFASGHEVIADGTYQAVFGRLNSPNVVDLFQVGAGTSNTNRWNALAVSGQMLRHKMAHITVSTQADLNVTLGVGDIIPGTYYRFVLNITVGGLGMPGGAWLVEGYKHDDNYQWQIIRRYGEGSASIGIMEYRRSKYNGTWTAWDINGSVDLPFVSNIHANVTMATVNARKRDNTIQFYILFSVTNMPNSSTIFYVSHYPISSYAPFPLRADTAPYTIISNASVFITGSGEAKFYTSGSNVTGQFYLAGEFTCRN